jgi:hypothetical protein
LSRSNDSKIWRRNQKSKKTIAISKACTIVVLVVFRTLRGLTGGEAIVGDLMDPYTLCHLAGP